jgi:hypothetical protein
VVKCRRNATFGHSLIALGRVSLAMPFLTQLEGTAAMSLRYHSTQRNYQSSIEQRGCNYKWGDVLLKVALRSNVIHPHRCCQQAQEEAHRAHPTPRLVELQLDERRKKEKGKKEKRNSLTSYA